jgi:hypothetical protein
VTAVKESLQKPGTYGDEGYAWVSYVTTEGDHPWQLPSPAPALSIPIAWDRGLGCQDMVIAARSEMMGS